jgi:predicted enzyme related to lactoylglutathione lyase
MIGSENPEKLRDFYKEVFQKDPDMSEGGYYGFLVGTGFLTVASHDKVHGKNPNPERILLNFEIEDVKAEFERIEKIEGAEVVAEPYEMGDEKMKATIATLADPDGNFFQLMTPWKG